MKIDSMAPRKSAQENQILGFLADGNLRTRDEIEQHLGFDPSDALDTLFDCGAISFTRAAGVGFWQIIT